MAYGRTNPAGIFGPGTQPAAPSFVPQIASLGDLMDTIAQRRMQIAKMEQDAAAADEKDKYNRSVESRKEAYGNRKQDLIEKRDTANEQFKQEEHNSKQRKYVRDQVGAGRNPGTVTYWKDGKPVTVQYAFEGGQAIEKPSPAQDMAPPPPAATPPVGPQQTQEQQGQPVPTMMGKPLMQSWLGQGPSQLPIRPPAPSLAPEASGEGQGTLSDPELDALMSRASQPQEPQEPQPQAAQDNTIFLDENDEGTTRALLPPGDTGRAELPMRAYPEGAKEGDRFAAEDVNLKGGYGNPFAGPAQPAQMRRPPEGGTVFFDENNDGTARALSGLDDGTHQDLPVEAFPPGAKEGDRFNAEDVNLRGGKGNPFSEPVPPVEMPQPNRDAGGTNNLLGVQSPTSTSTFVPGGQVRGYSATMPQQSGGGRWVARDKSGAEFDSVDMGEARKAKDDEDARQLQAINEALASPEAKIDPRMSQALITEKVSLLGRMSPDARKTLFAMQKQGQQIASNEGMQDKKLAAQAEQGDLNRTSRETMAANALTSKEKMATAAMAAKAKHGGASLSGAKMATGGGDFISVPTNSKGIPQPNQLLKQVTTDWRSWATEQDLKTQFKGLRRLAMAENNIDVSGKAAGVVNMEAAFNYLGFLRGGVPVQNETKEMLDHRRTWADSLHGLMTRAGIAELVAKVAKGEELTQEEKDAANNVMSAAEKDRIREGILESKKVMAIQVAQTLKPFAMNYATLEGPGGHLLQQGAVNRINADLEAIGLPHDYNPFMGTQLPSRSKNMREPGDNGSAQPSGAKPSLREALFPGQ